MPEPVLITILGTLAAAVLMFAVWLYQIRSRNASAVDVAWSFGVGAFGCGALALGDGDTTRRLVVGLLLGLWSLRLGSYLLFDRLLVHREEDGRYALLREEKGADWNRWALSFFGAQAVFVTLFALPAITLAYDPRPFGTVTDFAGIALWVLALGGESVADRQLARWRSNPANQGRTCRAGLWRYSRHPNYFFECLHWGGYALIAAGSAYWWIPAAHVVVVFLLVRFMTGVPYTERRALITRGDDYRAYQRTTSTLIPWFPRQETSS
ncbi:MAG: DUF1295 domain-containing protein [Planctomycetota bacterium]|jgi:steroid 5-alpha reductase family enzyme|nr:DUF1295 domain-containing protein [Planctomycetota bacterium]